MAPIPATATGAVDESAMNPFDADGWRAQAACRGLDVNMFIPDARGEGQLLYTVVRVICDACPVKQPCLEYALDNHEDHGMWGGTTPYERTGLGYKKLRLTCKMCGTMFLRDSAKERYCSDECREKRRHKRPA